jgi:hypothetical protein
MLSSMIQAAPARCASSACSTVSTSISTSTSRSSMRMPSCTDLIAAVTHLRRRHGSLSAEPSRTGPSDGFFRHHRRPRTCPRREARGAVLRVSKMVTGNPFTAATNRAVGVAIPLDRCKRLRAVRSPVMMLAARSLRTSQPRATCPLRYGRPGRRPAGSARRRVCRRARRVRKPESSRRSP